MTPDPSVNTADRQDTPVDSPPSLTDRAAAGAFGGQSSADSAIQEDDNGSLLLLLGFIGVILAIGFLRTWWIPGIVGGLLFILFMHELGHYLTARATGMKVTEFFLGFGPKIWSFTKGETEYGVKAIPAGAYVRIMGMTNLDAIDPAEEHRTYRAQPYWQRMVVICAGSAMHFLMATIGLFILFLSYAYPGFNGPPWVVGQVVEGSTASTLGIELGDEVVSVNGEGFANWDEFGAVVGGLEEGPVEILVERDGERQVLRGDLGLRPEDVLFDGFGLVMWDEDSVPGFEVSFLWPGEAAEQIGLQRNDVLLRAGDVDLPNSNTMALALREANEGTLELEIMRGDETIVLSGPLDLKTSPPFRGFFGVGPEFVPDEDPSAISSFGHSIGDFGTILKANIVGVGDMVSGIFTSDDGSGDERRAEVLRQQESQPIAPPSDGCNGPDTNRPLSIIGIGRVISCSDSADQVIFLLSIVNIFIGAFNLVPVLPLDGGHAAMATYERTRSLVTRKPYRVDAAKLIPVTWVVIVLLGLLGVWTAALDTFSWPG